MKTPLLLCLLFLPVLAAAYCFDEAGYEYGLDPLLLRSIARVESNMNSTALHRNPDGSVDIGLMQINSFWLERLNLNGSQLIAEPCTNVRTGANVLRRCVDRYGYTWQAVGCYNATSKGKKISYAWKVYKEFQKPGRKGQKDAEIAVDRKESSTIPVPSSLVFRVREKGTVAPSESGDK